MPPDYNNLTIRDRNGQRVAVKDCRIEPLNFLIPGMAPILVPKRTAWSSPSQQQAQRESESKRRTTTIQVQLPESDEDEDTDDDDDSIEVRPLLKRKPQVKAAKPKGGKCIKDSIVKTKAQEAKHSRRADRHQKRAEQERQEAAADHEKLQKRIEKQEAYIAKLKARYGGGSSSVVEKGKAKDKDEKKEKAAAKLKMAMKTAIKSSKKTPKKAIIDTDTETDADSGATTDGSAAVREMLKHMKIRAGGKDAPYFHVNDGDEPWTDSLDSMLWTIKETTTQWADVGKAMDREAKECKRRYKFLKDSNFEIPGGKEVTAGETTEADKTGEETTDVDKPGEATTGAETTDEEATGAETTDADAAGAETTDADKTGAETTEAEATDVDKPKDVPPEWTDETDAQLMKLKDDNKSWAEIVTEMGVSKEDLRARFKSLQATKSNPTEDAAAHVPTDTTNDEAKKLAALLDAHIAKHKRFTTAASPESTSRHSASGDPGFAGAGTAAYIERYSRNLLAEAYAGRVLLPQPDEVFDEADCMLLALAESRRREHRWLEIQADFANVTGRLVPVEVLKWKLGQRDGNAPEYPEDQGE